MFLPAAIGLILLIIGLAASQGQRTALWAAWSLTLLVPTWDTTTILSLEFDLRTIAGFTVVACFVTMPFVSMFRRWLLCDTLMLAAVCSQWLSMAVSDTLSPTVFLVPITHLLLPYLFGRLAISRLEDVRGFLRWLAYVIVAMGSLAVVESFTHVNLIDSVFGTASFSDVRFDFSRAHGPMSHPIYFGMAFALLFPWAAWGAVLARRGEAPRWWLVLPIFCAIGVLSALSRGPTIVLIGTLGCAVFFLRPRARLWLAGGAVAFGILIAVAGDRVLDGLRFTETSGGREKEPLRVAIDGKMVEYDGTLHRILLFEYYGEAVWEGGMLGQGPPKAGETDELTSTGDLSSVMGSVDNHYLFYTLRYGFLGIGLFIWVASCGLYYTGREAMDATRPGQAFTAAHFGSLGMVTLLLLTVWFSTDFAWVWLFSLGYAAAWRAHGVGLATADQPNHVAPPLDRNGVIRRLVPGHPVIQ